MQYVSDFHVPCCLIASIGTPCWKVEEAPDLLNVWKVIWRCCQLKIQLTRFKCFDNTVNGHIMRKNDITSSQVSCKIKTCETMRCHIGKCQKMRKKLGDEVLRKPVGVSTLQWFSECPISWHL